MNLEPGGDGQFLIFGLLTERYAIPVRRVREIIEYREMTAIPQTPAYVGGVINLRGIVVPVIDLGHKLGLAPCRPGRDTCIVIVELATANGELVLGVLADSAQDVIELPLWDIEPPPPFGAPVGLEYLQGVAKRSDGFLLLLDLERALGSNAGALAVEGAARPWLGDGHPDGGGTMDPEEMR